MATMASILVVDDEPDVLHCIEWTLEDAGYQVLTAQDGLEALAALQLQPIDLILADIAMPRLNGYQLHQCIAKNPQWATIPFLFVTGRAEDSDIRYGKELGVDDYLTKPFVAADLLAAVQGRFRRAQQLAGSYAQLIARPAARSEVLAVGRLRIDPSQYAVWLNGQPIQLSATEFRLLEYLAQRPNQVVSLQELTQVTHDLKTDRTDAGGLLRPLIRSLRRKLGYSTGELGCIKSVRGVGYQLTPPNV